MEEEILRDTQERDAHANKVRVIQEEISKVEDVLRPVLMKKVKLLDQELIQVKGEKDILAKQIESLKQQQQEGLDNQNKLLEDANAQVANLKQNNIKLQQRFARLTYKDTSISLDEHMKTVAKVNKLQPLIIANHSFRSMDHTAVDN